MSEHSELHHEHMDEPDWLPGGSGGLVGNLLPAEEASALEDIGQELADQGEAFEDGDQAWLRRQFGDPKILEGLAETEEKTGIPLEEFIRHSFRFHHATERGTSTGAIAGEDITIETGEHNLLHTGEQRRTESGSKVDIERIEKLEIDPSKVLFFRVTQPSDTPKPEYYWTSDSVEARNGLTWELGEQAETAIVLVATLDTIAQNGGLIEDVNDDQGVAVRQIDLGPFDQKKALYSFERRFK
jgi:hypothetical protein